MLQSGYLKLHRGTGEDGAYFYRWPDNYQGSSLGATSVLYSGAACFVAYAEAERAMVVGCLRDVRLGQSPDLVPS